MTGMEKAIERAARAIYGAVHRDTDPYSVPLERAAERAARALAADGLLALAPLTEVQAEAWDEGYADGHSDGQMADRGDYALHDNYNDDRNPYRKEATR